MYCRRRWNVFYTVSINEFVLPMPTERPLGFSVLMFLGTVWALTHKCRMQDVNRPISVVAIMLFLISTAVGSSHITYDAVF
jgi:hypothetical protein